MKPENEQTLDILQEYLEKGKTLKSPPEVVYTNPGKITAVGSAGSAGLQCYRPGTILPVEDGPSIDEERVASDTMRDAHTTPWEHKHFRFHISGLSRFVIQQLFHIDPCASSDQISQRFAKITATEESLNPDNIFIPEMSPELTEKFLEVVAMQYCAFGVMKEALYPEVRNQLAKRYPVKDAKNEKAWRIKSDKVSQEIARYFLPLCQKAEITYTINNLQLIRLIRASKQERFTAEARYIIARMVYAVAEQDKTVLSNLRLPLEKQGREPTQDDWDKITEYLEDIDQEIGDQRTRIVESPNQAALRVIGIQVEGAELDQEFETTEEAVKYLLDPRNNSLLLQKYGVGLISQLPALLRGLHFSFVSKMSASAYAQAQRHRFVPQPVLSIERQFNGRADYMTPSIILQNPALKELYDSRMMAVYAGINECISMGMPLEYAAMLLPNAHTMRMMESGDLLSWLNRWQQRMCYNAQEEIFHISLEQIKQVIMEFPFVRHLLGAPCTVRKSAGVRPMCTEGDRKCREPVWSYSMKEYEERVV